MACLPPEEILAEVRRMDEEWLASLDREGLELSLSQLGGDRGGTDDELRAQIRAHCFPDTVS